MTPIPIPCPHCGAVLKIRDPNVIGHRAKCPKCAQVFRMEVAAAVGAAAGAATAGGLDQSDPVFPAARAVEELSLPSFPTEGIPQGAAGHAQALRKKNRKRSLIMAVFSALVLLAAGSVGLYVYHYAPSSLPVEVAAEVEADDWDDAEAQAAATDPSVPAKEVQPIDLQYIPAGARIVIQVRPAELWQPDSRGEEFRYCLGPVFEFLAEKTKRLAKREPAQVREALFCLISGERGTAPELAAVFHLNEEAKKSELLDQFGGRRMETTNSIPYYVTDDRLAYLFPDLQTIAVCPANLAEEMTFAIQERNPTSEGILDLLPMTDRSRPVTVLFDPVTTRIDAEFLMPSTAIPLLEQFCDWLGADVETVAWSLQLQKEFFRSELIVRNQAGKEPRVLERTLRKNLDELAENVLHVVQQMQPKEVGKRKVIGRFPVMTKAFSLATRTKSGPRSVQLETRLPERAAPNLALGALLAWDESTRTILKSKSAVEPSADKPDNAPIAEKLQRKITVEFKKTPLQVAFETIAEEIHGTVVIDGDGLKLSAYTKNMEQNFALENVPAIKVVERILKQPMYDKMCMVVDDKKNSFLITTYPAAEQKGLKPYEFPQ